MRNDFPISERLKELYKTKNIDTNKWGWALDVAKNLFDLGYLDYADYSEHQNNNVIPGDDTVIHANNTVKRTLQNHVNGKMPSADYIIIYCKYFGCSSDYLLGLIDTPLHTQYDDIPLDFETIQNLNAIREQCNKNDTDDITVTVMSDGKLKRTPQQRVNTLNKLLSSEYFLHIVYAFHNFINSTFSKPVHFNPSSNGVPGGWVLNDTPMDRTNYIDDNGNIVETERYIYLAKDGNVPSDNIPLIINETFIENVELENIKTYLREIKKGCL